MEGTVPADAGDRARPQPALLLVDDDTEVLAAARRELRRWYGDHYRVLCRRSAQDALAALREMRREGQPVAVVLSDVWMEEMSGSEFLARVRRIHPHARRALISARRAWGWIRRTRARNSLPDISSIQTSESTTATGCPSRRISRSAASASWAER